MKYFGRDGTWTLVKPRFGGHRWGLSQLAHVPGSTTTLGVGSVTVGQRQDGLIAVDGPLPR